jgi:signal transduction histidine kinase
MTNTPFQDPRASDLLSRVSDDVSLLRQDVTNLLSHAARHTLPSGARDLADSARNRLAAGKLYSADQLRALRGQVNQPAAAWVGGALAVGLIAAGIYLFCKSDCCGESCEDEEMDD